MFSFNRPGRPGSGPGSGHRSRPSPATAGIQVLQVAEARTRDSAAFNDSKPHRVGAAASVTDSEKRRPGGAASTDSDS